MKYYSTYIKVRVPTLKNPETTKEGVFFGGVYNTKEEAEEATKDLVNRNRGGTLLPKIFEGPDNANLVDVMYEAEEKFERLWEQMLEAKAQVERADEVARAFNRRRSRHYRQKAKNWG